MKLAEFTGAKGSPGKLKINPSNVTCISQNDSGTGKSATAYTRIWVSGGDYFTVHGTLDEVDEKLIKGW